METERKVSRMFSLEERSRAVELYLTTPMTTAQVVECLGYPTRCILSTRRVPSGVVTFCWTPVSLFFDYAMSPSSRLRLAMLVPKASLIRSSRYQRMYPSNCSTNPSMVTPVKLRPWKNSCLRRPKNPSAAALSGLQPFALIDRVNIRSF